MARTVFILGAGASAELGAPTISTFMRAIRDVEGTPGILEYKNDFSAVLQGYRLLQPAYAKMRMNYENDIEELFATFETARILGETVLGNIDPGELSRSMKRVIASTIEEKMRFSLGSRSDYGAVVFPHRQYIDFARLLRGLHTSGRSDSSVAILTFNYDVGLDQALEHFLIPFSYGFESNSNANTIPYLKLHGSLNWGVCRRCKKIIPLSLSEFWKPTEYPLQGETPLRISRQLKHLKHCDLPLEEEPLIVPPVWNKSDSQATISQVWKTAYRELSNAINIYVIGYSIPPSDQFFKHLLALSLAQGPILDRVVALNPEQQAYDRLKSLMSETVQAKAGFIPARFDGGSEQIARHLGITLANKPEGWEQN